MELLKLEEIQEQLQKKYGESAQKSPLHFGAFIPGAAPMGQAEQVDAVSVELSGRPLPENFRNILKIWDFGNLILAGFRFAVGGNYANAVSKMNKEVGSEWWADREIHERPSNLLMVAQSDPYILLLDLNNGAILAFTSTIGSEDARIVAYDINQLVRALGSVELLSHQAQNIELFTLNLTQSLGTGVFDEFWIDQIDHWAQFS